MGDRGQPAQGGRGVHQDVQPAEALQQAGADRLDLVALGQVERQQRRLAAGGADRVVGILQAALGAGDKDRTGAEAGQLDRHRCADAAAGACDEGDFAREGGS